MEMNWKNVLQEHWGIDATLTQLDGEFDLNFLAETASDGGYILKVMRAGCEAELVELQIAALAHATANNPDLPLPAVVPAGNGQSLIAHETPTGEVRLLWVLTRLPGRTYAGTRPKTLDLVAHLGSVMGDCDVALSGFEHGGLDREFQWDLMQSAWVSAGINDAVTGQRRTLLQEIDTAFQGVQPALATLPKQAAHNDVNDYNILVSGTLSEPRRVSGLIDFGDLCRTPRICNLAIAAAYIVLDVPDPEQKLTALVAGYHARNPLTAEELDLLWPLLRMRLAASLVNSTRVARKKPDDPYVTISQAPAWRFLESTDIDADLLKARLRAACALPVTDAADRIHAFLAAERGNFAPIIGQDLRDVPMGSLSVENSLWPQNPFDMGAAEAARIGEEHGEKHEIWLGYYCEPRLIYTGAAFRKDARLVSDRRTVHLAVDIFAPATTPIHAPMAGRVHFVANKEAHLDYGGVVILEHSTPGGDIFYSLYGHLDPAACNSLTKGDRIEKGATFCALGDNTQNGGWAPHLHFQLGVTLDGLGDDWPGVGDPDELHLWTALCPNPAAFLNLDDAKTAYMQIDKPDLLKTRYARFADNMVLTYSDPIMFLRGWKHYLFDEWGRPYLDAYNNVPHVGHAHPRLQDIATDQMARMNSNTRYLHPAQMKFADKLLSKLPDEFEVCFFVNSGSEGNELALRLARAHTGAKGMISPDHGYHGNTTGAMDVSAYKFNAKGGHGQPDWVEIVDVADPYRGQFRGDDPQCAQKYADLVDGAIARLSAKDIALSGFIAETFPSVGGQIIPPRGYLGAVYDKIRAAGGVCIADEVQTGLGRLGDYYFGFEQQGAVPEIVVLGKPMGNGHPIGVVITTRAIANSFGKGPEFFSTFGGSTLSCRIGCAVLDLVDEEGLQENAKVQGARLMDQLHALKEKHACIGDVRGIGLFNGVELVTDRDSMAEAPEIASYVKNRLREHRILIGTDGPKDNILKIRPPLTITPEDADLLASTLDAVLSELD